jgi:hypothetical protein
MARSSRVLHLMAFLACLTMLSPSAAAWSNGGYSADQNNPDYGTHDWIADMALDLQTRNATFLTSTYHAHFLLGTEAPDNRAFIGDTTNHHVYYYSTQELQDDICAVRASEIYELALGYLVTGEYNDAAFDIGVLAHYVADPGVFGHTMGAYTDWGAETHHSDYENEIESMTSTLVQPTGITLGNLDAYNATLQLGRTTTFGEGEIQSNVWMDDNYNWSDATFVASAMASLYASVAAVAAVMNHLLVEANQTESPPSPEVPQPPSSFEATLNGSSVVLTWTPPSYDGGAAIVSYVLYRGSDPESPSRLANVSGDTFNWIDQSVERGRTYYYWIVAVNSVGASDMIRMASATVPRNSDSLTLSIVVSTISIALAGTGGALLWRRKRRGASRP